MNALQALYKGRYRGGVVHSDRGDGKPLCNHYQHWNITDNATKWLQVKKSVSCRHCLQSLKTQQPVVKQTLWALPTHKSQ